MKIEIHVLQNFASSNLNRDDTGTPKDCELGGVRRARISSQCLKRAMREAFAVHELIPLDQRAARTKRLVERCAVVVAAKRNVALEVAEAAVARALGGAGIKAEPTKQMKTQYLLFLPTRAVDQLADLVVTNFDALQKGDESPKAQDDSSAQSSSAGKGKKAPSAKQTKAAAKEEVPKELSASVSKLLASGASAPEIALFGRMIADAPEWNVDAACQVAHAVSTHRVSMEFDFYTAIDDLKKEDAAGSDMMGTISFNSACFYRYLVVDTDALARSLGGDADARDKARDTVEALIRAAVLAIPSGKQNSMAAHNLPSLVLTDVREGAESRSLTNAFVDPVRPKAGSAGDLVSQSVHKLALHLAALDQVYGSNGRQALSFFLVHEQGELADTFAAKTAATNRRSLEGLVSATVDAAFGAEA